MIRSHHGSFHLLSHLIFDPHPSLDVVVSSAVLVLKYLVQTQLQSPSSQPQSESPMTIISHLAQRIDDIKHSQARACVLWLVGQYSASEDRASGVAPEGVAEWAPDVLRRSAKTFAQEVRYLAKSFENESNSYLSPRLSR